MRSAAEGIHGSRLDPLFSPGAMRKGTRPIAVLLAGAVFAGRADSAPPPTDREGYMRMKYERTFLGVNIANVDVTFDSATRERFAALAAGQHYSDELAERMAPAALEAETVSLYVQFLRSASTRRAPTSGPDWIKSVFRG